MLQLRRSGKGASSSTSLSTKAPPPRSVPAPHRLNLLSNPQLRPRSPRQLSHSSSSSNPNLLHRAPTRLCPKEKRYQRPQKSQRATMESLRRVTIARRGAGSGQSARGSLISWGLIALDKRFLMAKKRSATATELEQSTWNLSERRFLYMYLRRNPVLVWNTSHFMIRKMEGRPISHG